jgi:hypothetical protein
MATVAAIFDDSVALEKAVDSLQRAGLGDAIVDISENHDADTAPERSETPGGNDTRDDVAGVVPLAGAGGVTGGGTTGTHGTVPLLGGFFGGRGDHVSGYLDRLGDDAEPFRLAAERGGKLIVLETDDVDQAVATLQQAGAQELYDPR